MPKSTVFPETAAEALAKWDAGEIVWTIEMGGMGPGYEQAIHVAAFECIRALQGYNWPAEPFALNGEILGSIRRVCESGLSKCHDLHLSGMQAGAAMNLAISTCRTGYREWASKYPEDRGIMVSRHWVTNDHPPKHTLILV